MPSASFKERLLAQRKAVSEGVASLKEGSTPTPTKPTTDKKPNLNAPSNTPKAPTPTPKTPTQPSTTASNKKRKNITPATSNPVQSTPSSLSSTVTSKPQKRTQPDSEGATENKTPKKQKSKQSEASSDADKTKTPSSSSSAPSSSSSSSSLTASQRRNKRKIAKRNAAKGTKKKPATTTTTGTSATPTPSTTATTTTTTPNKNEKTTSKKKKKESKTKAQTPNQPKKANKGSNNSNNNNTDASKAATKKKAEPQDWAAKASSMQDQLLGAQFRWINEKMYTCSSEDAVLMMSQDPELFDAYHKGYRAQVKKWPVNPLDLAIKMVRANPGWVVGDFGCGDGRLAESVSNKVHSFDLVANKPHVTACNIAKVPLEAGVLDAAVFCLSLMGTDYMKFLAEAHRTLKLGAKLLVAEVQSRFQSTSAGDFIAEVESAGFKRETVDDKNPYFVFLTFTKSSAQPSKLQAEGVLKACQYKKR